MTNERLLELAEYYSDNRKLVEYDRLNFEITSYVISQQELLKFALAIHEDGYNKGYEDGWECSKVSTEMNTWNSDDD